MTRPPRYTARLSYDDALLLWRARAVYRVQAVITGLVILVFLGELVSSFLLGFWVYGLLIVGLGYHRWATGPQLLTAYPQLPRFLAAKAHYDPAGLFQSDWYRWLRRTTALEAAA